MSPSISSKIPLEVGRMIMEHLVQCPETHLTRDDVQNLRSARYLGFTKHADAAGEILFRKIVVRNQNKGSPQYQNIRKLSESSLAGHVREIIIDLDLRYAHRYAAMPNAKSMSMFESWLRDTGSMLAKFSETQQLTLQVEGIFHPSYPGHEGFTRALVQSIGGLGKTLPSLERVRFLGHRSIGSGFLTMIQQDFTQKLAQIEFDLESSCKLLPEDARELTEASNLRFPDVLPSTKRLRLNGQCFERYSRTSSHTYPLRGFQSLDTPVLQELVLHNVELDSQNSLTTFLGRQAETLQGIQLKSVGMRPEDWSDVLDVIVTMPGLTRLSIHSLAHRGSSDHVISIGKTAFKAPLKELRLSETWASADLVTTLISKASETLEHVHLERYTAYGRSICIFTSILAALKSCDKLTQLCVDGCMSPSLQSSSTLQFQEAMKAVKDQRPCGKNTHGPTIQENWALSHLPIDYGRSRYLDEWSPMEQNSYSADFESVPFRLGELLRLVLSRGGNQDPCGFSSKHSTEDCRSHIFGCDRVYDQEGFAALLSWDEFVSECEARAVSDQAAQDEEDNVLANDMPW